jgi:hypothetical protein
VFHDRDEIKRSLPLQDIQTRYFEFIDHNFGTFFKEMKRRRLTPHDIGRALSEPESSRKELAPVIPEFVAAIKEYWAAAGPAARIHLEDMGEPVKAIFGGDLFPANNESIASKCGVYADTIILPDPFIRSEWSFGRQSEVRNVYYFIKHGMNVLKYKELVDAGLDLPIIAIAPDFVEEADKTYFGDLGKSDALIHAEKLFGVTFETIDEFSEFVRKLRSPEDVIAKAKDPRRLLFDSDWGPDPKVQFEHALNGQYAELLGSRSAGLMVEAQTIGRMAVSNEMLIKAARFRGTPIIDAPTSWQYFVWKLEYDALRAEREKNLEDLHVMKGLQAVADNEMEWLGKIPHEALIELRKAGALQEIRQILGKGIAELVSARPLNFYRTADQIFDNIHAAFADHRAKLAELSSKKWRFAGKDIGTWLAVGTLEIAAAATGHPFYGLATVAAHQVTDPPKLKDIPKAIRDLAAESKELNRSPVGMLFSYSKD